MPSLPELEVYQQQFTRELVGRSIKQIEVFEYRVVRTELGVLTSHLVGHKLAAISRYGKWLIWDTGGSAQLVLHLGLTGKLTLSPAKEKLPSSSALALHFDNGLRLVLADQRKLGKVYIRKFADLKSEKKLGPDLLELNRQDFVEAFQGKQRAARDVLMDQKIIAGIGGKYADEILWQAKLHPHAKLDSLTAAALGRLYDLTLSVTKKAIALDADVERFPDDWLIPHRRADKTCPRCGTELVEHSSIFHCPRCQPAPNPYRRG